ncbi:uncharacterized protein LOC121729488 [Aricia agestis]|uniref:uncharacterized protein LOC121729488 n=1 Tax=Aricia agestis TaxID=91739 RepID=UPI001C202696|nr:uncharacterized protein LOC121729488 [Aricia agestis]
MYRVLCLLVTLTVASGFCHHKHKGWHRHHLFRDNDVFDDVTEQMSRLNQILKSACDNDRTTEIFEAEKFVINHQLPEYKVDYIDVVIKGRVIQTIAKKSVNDRDQFRDLRILPMNADVGRATWNYVSDSVVIIIPFVEDKKQFCPKDDGDIKLVPREKVYDIDVRFGEELVH